MHIVHVAALTVCAASLSSQAGAQVAEPATVYWGRLHASGVAEIQLESGSRSRQYRLFVPPAYDGRTR